MPPPPPPPPRLPPSAPLPPPPPPSTGHTPQISNHSTSTPDRSALLSQIRGGTKLKSVATNDRSSPLVQKSHSSASGNRAKNQSITASGNGTKTQTVTASGPMGLGDLFSHGIPKLRPVGSRAGDTNTAQHSSSSHNNSFHPGVNKAVNASPGPSLAPSEAQITKPSRIQTRDGQTRSDQHILNPSINVTKPVPPPSKLKPNFISESTAGNTSFPRTPLQNKTPVKTTVNTLTPAGQNSKEDSRTRSCSKPLPPPKQIQATIKSDGNVQTKPLPPTKLSATWNTNVPTHSQNTAKANGLAKPPRVNHSPSFTASSLACDKQNNMPEYKEKMSTLAVNPSRLPVRNHSAPDNLNQLIRNNSSRPPPPPIPPTNRVIQSSSPRHPPQIKFQNGRPSPPPQPPFQCSSEPPPLPKTAPPPLPYRSPQTLPRFEGKRQAVPPPLPVRTASKQSNQQATTHDIELRFKQLFHDTQEFPFPHYKITPHKFYMSQAYTQEMREVPTGNQTRNRLLVGKAAEC